MLEYIQSRSLPSCNSIKSFDFFTPYTTIPYSKLKDRLRELVQLFFIKKNGKCRYKYLLLGKDRSYFVSEKNPLCFYQKVLWNWSHRNARVFDWQHICYVWWTCFSTDSWHSYRYKLCSSFRRCVPLFVWGRPHDVVDCYGISVLQITTDMFHLS
jgi:hypothetical protein